LHFLYLFLFLSSPDFCPVHQYTLYHILKDHHSPPEITYPLSLSYSLNTSHYLICFPHYLSDMCLIRGSFIECVIQVLELVYLFCFSSFPVPLILFTLLHSLIYHHHFRLLNIHFHLFLAHILFQALHHFFHFSFFVVSNQSPSFFPIFPLFFVLACISSIFRTSHSLIPLSLPHYLSLSLSLSLIYPNIFSLSTLSNAALRSTNSVYLLPSFLFNSLFVT
jgi:hypothetical protein